jgi:hypothetical protein
MVKLAKLLDGFGSSAAELTCADTTRLEPALFDTRPGMSSLTV